MWLHVERSLQQQQLIQNHGSDSAATGSRAVVVPKREDEELKPIIPNIAQERPVKTERVTTRSLRQPSLKKDTSNDGVATKSGMAVPKREEKECKPSSADTNQGRPLRTKNRERSASGASSTTANSSDLDADRVLRPSTSVPVPVPVGRGNATPPSLAVTPRKTATGTATQSTFVYGIQPYKAVHDKVPKVSKAGLVQGLLLTKHIYLYLYLYRALEYYSTRNTFLRISKQFWTCRNPPGAPICRAMCGIISA
jgi:hypothetical protein